MPTDPSQLTIGAGSNVGSLAGNSSNLIRPSFSGQNPINANSPLITGYTPPPPAPAPITTQQFQIPQVPTSAFANPSLPMPKTSTGSLAHFGSALPSSDFSHPTVSTTPIGGSAATDTNGNVVGSSNFNVDTSGASTQHLISSPTVSDINNQQTQYQQYLQQLSRASQYSPAYIAANSAYQSDVANNAQLANQINNPYGVGSTMGQLETTIQRAQTGNAAQEAADAVALNAQTLARQGDIAGAQALVQGYAPQTVSPGSSLVSPATGESVYSGLGGYQAVQGIQTTNGLMASFPDAGITQADSPEVATQKAMQAPSFQSRNLIGIPLPGGGYSFVNKNQLRTNADGSYTYVSPQQATQVQAASDAVKNLTQQKADVTRAVSTADANFPLLLQAAQNAGVNNSVPFINALQQRLGSNFSSSPAFAALQTLIPSLQTEYSQIIARGGTVTNETRDNAQSIVNGTYNLKQLQQVYTTLQAESKNVLNGYDKAISDQTAALNSIGTPIPTQTQNSSGNPFSASAFAQ